MSHGRGALGAGQRGRGGSGELSVATALQRDGWRVRSKEQRMTKYTSSLGWYGQGLQAIFSPFVPGDFKENIVPY